MRPTGGWHAARQPHRTGCRISTPPSIGTRVHPQPPGSDLHNSNPRNEEPVSLGTSPRPVFSRPPRRQGPRHMEKSNKMLIDATHPEETRVVVLRNGRVEEFDYESAARKLLRGNIYLAKVTRVEPSLQAAFVDSGGNRHGFLAFSEIPPDYYHTPVADRQALLQEEAEADAEA